MRDCTIDQFDDRLTIRPSWMTLIGPLLALGVLGALLVFGVRFLVLMSPTEAERTLTDQQNWPYAVLTVILFVGACVWFRYAASCIVLDRQAGELRVGGHRESIASARAVAVTVVERPESPDLYHVEIVLLGRKLRLGRFGWSGETSAARAERNAAIVANFLDLPLQTDYE